MVKNLGGCRITVKVLLELQPADCPPRKLLAGSPAVWDVASPGAAAGGAQDLSPAQRSQAAASPQLHAPARQAASPPPAAASPAQVLPSPLQPHGSKPPAADGGSAASSPAPSPWSSPAGQASYTYRPLPGSPSRGPSPAPAPAQPPADPCDALRRPLLLNAEDSGFSACSSAAAAGSDRQSPATAASAVVAALRSPLPPAAASALTPRRLQADVSHVAAPSGAATTALVVSTSSASGGWVQPEATAATAGPAAAWAVPPAADQVKLCVERALNLDLPDLPEDLPESWVSACYLRYEWPGSGTTTCSPLVPAVRGPLGGVCSAQWAGQQLLPLAPGLLARGGNSPLLVLQVRVWCLVDGL
jgi:hypothetical protein